MLSVSSVSSGIFSINNWFLSGIIHPDVHLFESYDASFSWLIATLLLVCVAPFWSVVGTLLHPFVREELWIGIVIVSQNVVFAPLLHFLP